MRLEDDLVKKWINNVSWHEAWVSRGNHGADENIYVKRCYCEVACAWHETYGGLGRIVKLRESTTGVGADPVAVAKNREARWGKK